MAQLSLLAAEGRNHQDVGRRTQESEKSDAASVRRPRRRSFRCRIRCESQRRAAVHKLRVDIEVVTFLSIPRERHLLSIRRERCVMVMYFERPIEHGPAGRRREATAWQRGVAAALGTCLRTARTLSLSIGSSRKSMSITVSTIPVNPVG